MNRSTFRPQDPTGVGEDALSTRPVRQSTVERQLARHLGHDGFAVSRIDAVVGRGEP